MTTEEPRRPRARTSPPRALAAVVAVVVVLAAGGLALGLGPLGGDSDGGDT
jgi:hypothetical protein